MLHPPSYGSMKGAWNHSCFRFFALRTASLRACFSANALSSFRPNLVRSQPPEASTRRPGSTTGMMKDPVEITTTLVSLTSSSSGLVNRPFWGHVDEVRGPVFLVQAHARSDPSFSSALGYSGRRRLKRSIGPEFRFLYPIVSHRCLSQKPDRPRIYRMEGRVVAVRSSSLLPRAFCDPNALLRRAARTP